MKILRLVSAFLLALPLLVSGSNYFLHLFPMPPGDGSAGDQFLQAMRQDIVLRVMAALEQYFKFVPHFPPLATNER